MKRVLGISIVALLFFTSSCKVNFTGKLRSQIEAQNLDLKKIQYYNSQRIVLRRVLSTSDTKVASGEVRLQNGLQVEEIKIKKNTPGVCDSLMKDGMRVRFENEKGRFFVFQQNAYGEYMLVEQNKGEVIYEGKKYYANTSISRPTLKIMKKETSKFAKNSRSASGVRVQ